MSVTLSDEEYEELQALTLLLHLTPEQYQALVSLAWRGATTADSQRDVAVFLRGIDKQNGIERNVLVVLWQETDSALPPTARFPAKWPPELMARVEVTGRAVSKQDVDAVLRAKARRPGEVWITKDPGGALGLDTYAAVYGSPYQP